jgi:hypothetical protein
LIEDSDLYKKLTLEYRSTYTKRYGWEQIKLCHRLESLPKIDWGGFAQKLGIRGKDCSEDKPGDDIIIKDDLVRPALIRPDCDNEADYPVLEERLSNIMDELDPMRERLRMIGFLLGLYASGEKTSNAVETPFQKIVARSRIGA